MVSLWEKQHGSVRTRTQEKKVALVILNDICGLISHGPSRSGVVSNRLEKSLRAVEQLAIHMQCIYRMLFLGVNFRILENLDAVFGRLPCFWMYHFLCTITLRMHKSSTSELLNLCRMM